MALFYLYLSFACLYVVQGCKPRNIRNRQACYVNPELDKNFKEVM